MYIPERRLFRSVAIQQHLEHRRQDVLPHLVSPRIVRLIWIILVCVVVAGICIWNLPVPMHLSGFGLIAEDAGQEVVSSSSSDIFVFVQANELFLFKSGQSVQLQGGRTNSSFQGIIVQVKPDLMSYDLVRQRYRLPPDVLSDMTQPLATLIVKPEHVYPLARGTVLIATVSIGSKNILSLF
ncbi:hypothetical protein [Dictyobacter kobayashii]|uniref:Uncharacterized protein n=1 Tax=Dictyobacter kobayashii TaxID=2014872 RepID=A0A402AT34_9CHLR|nr:hypothetical protein [Dictyobacter kobayashii]GCE22203.1 hypothetical protein KDK_60030 [Dictyobacter kobayashii]